MLTIHEVPARLYTYIWGHYLYKLYIPTEVQVISTIVSDEAIDMDRCHEPKGPYHRIPAEETTLHSWIREKGGGWAEQSENYCNVTILGSKSSEHVYATVHTYMYLYACTYAHVHTHVHTYMYIHVQTHVHTYMHVIYVHTYKYYTYTYACPVHTHMYIQCTTYMQAHALTLHTYMHIHVRIHESMYMHACTVHICTWCIYVNTHTMV